MIWVESPLTLPIFLRMASALAQSSALSGFTYAVSASRAVSFTEVPLAAAFSFSRLAVSLSTLRTKMSTMARSSEDDISMISYVMAHIQAAFKNVC
jgi:hypothetical protein